MSAFFFGESTSTLFGVLTPASGQHRRDHGVLLCPPIGQEHVRTHWALRQVAVALSRSGFDCLRFDWFGVGDSSGDLKDASITRWVKDAVDAAQELRDAAGVQRISLVGLRLGATLATLAAKEINAHSIVLWDPVADGKSFINEMRDLSARLLNDKARFFNFTTMARKVATSSELVGFEYGDRLLREIEQTAIDDNLLAKIPATFLLRATESDDIARFSDRLQKAQPSSESADAEVKANWTATSAIEELLLPGDSVRTISDFLERRAS